MVALGQRLELLAPGGSRLHAVVDEITADGQLRLHIADVLQSALIEAFIEELSTTNVAAAAAVVAAAADSDSDSASSRFLSTASDDECIWNYTGGQCEPTWGCSYDYKFGDLTFSQSCRSNGGQSPPPGPTPVTPTPTPPADCGSAHPNDECCGWSYDIGGCVPTSYCSYQYVFGDLTLDKSCRYQEGGINNLDHGPLATFLRNLVINIPDTTMSMPMGSSTFSLGTIDMTVSKFDCQNIFINSLSSKKVKDTGFAKMAYAIDGIGATCKGNWAYKYGLLSGSGNLVAVVADSKFGLELELKPDANLYAAESVVATGCDLQVNIAQLDFGGSLEGYIINMFTGPIELLVETSLGTLVCGKVETGIADAINPQITKVSVCCAAKTSRRIIVLTTPLRTPILTTSHSLARSHPSPLPPPPSPTPVQHRDRPADPKRACRPRAPRPRRLVVRHLEGSELDEDGQGSP